VPNDDSFIKYAVNKVLNIPPHHVTKWNKDVFLFIARKYNLAILDIVYEKTQPYHIDWFIYTLIWTLIFGKEKIVEKNFFKTLVSKSLFIFVKFFKKRFYKEFLPEDMTMVVVFRKNENESVNR